jgi:hypothetical protein
MKLGGSVRRWLVGGAAMAAAAGALVPALGGGGAQLASYSPPAIRHVFVIVLENESETSTFGSTDPYMGLGGTLQQLGVYLPNFYATGHVSNDNYVAMVSGQAPNPQTQGDCQIYSDFVGTGPLVSGTGTLLDGQAVGTGCVYPASVKTVADQLSAAGLTWKGYMEDMGNVPSRESAVCGHPALNSQDKTQSAVPGDGYVSRHDPFVYFHSIIDTPLCNNVVPLGSLSGAMPAGTPAGVTGLATDLADGTVPNLSFITPNVCDDGHDFTCTNEPTPGKSAVDDMDRFLEPWVHAITSSAVFQKDGLLLVTFDEGAVGTDASSCCNEGPGPDSPLPGITGFGGGKIGAVAISPFIKPGSTSSTAYDHYAMLGSIEDLFGLSRLGYAADVTATFGPDVYNN